MVYSSSFALEDRQRLSKIIKTVCDAFEVEAACVSQSKKINQYSTKQDVISSYARLTLMSLLGNHLKQREIAQLMGCNVPSTISAAKARLNQLININPYVKDKVMEIINKLK